MNAFGNGHAISPNEFEAVPRPAGIN